MEKLVANDMESGEGHDLLYESLQGVVVGDEVTQKVQHQGMVSEGLSKVTERIFHALHLVAVLTHGQVSLRE